MIDEEAKNTLLVLANADGAKFTKLVKLAGLDPKVDFRHADLSDIDFEDCDLSGFDFTGANLDGAKLDRAYTTGAIFAGASTTNVRWPTRTFIDPLKSAKKTDDLREIQDRAVKIIDDKLNQKRQARVLAVMPAGTGRSAVTEALLVRLFEKNGFERILLVTHTAAEREQYLSRFRNRLGDKLVCRSSDDENMMQSKLLMVETVSKLKPRSTVSGPASKLYEGGAFDLVILPDITPSIFSILTTMVKTIAREGRLIAFSRMPLDHYSPARFKKLNEIFGGTTFEYSVDEAVGDGVLLPSLIETSDSIEDEKNAQVKADRFCHPSHRQSLLNETAKFVLRQLQSDTGIILCPDAEFVQQFSVELDNRLHEHNSSREGHRVVALTSLAPEEQVVSTLLEKQGTIIAMTERMAERIDLLNANYVVALVALQPKLLQSLAYAPPRPSRNGPMHVLDLAENFRGRLE